MRSLDDYESLKTSKGRKKHKLFLLEGPRIVRDWILGNGTVEDILCDSSRALDLTRSGSPVLNKISPRILDPRSFARISDTVHSQGIVAVAPIPNGTESFQGPVLALNGVQDPGNTGTILRSAVAFGVTEFLLDPESADPYAPKTVRSSGGALLHAKIRRTPEFFPILTQLKTDGYRIFALDGTGKGAIMELAKAPERSVLLVGNEGQGIDPAVLSLAHHRLCIQIGSIESLNAATAAAIALFVWSQKKSAPR